MKLILEGYDKATERIAEEVDVTEIGFETAADIIGIPLQDLVDAHPLTLEQLDTIGQLAGIKTDAANFDYFLTGESEYPGERWP